MLLGDDHRKKQKRFRISDVDIASVIADALIALHAFSGYECISTSFRKMKNVCFKDTTGKKHPQLKF